MSMADRDGKIWMDGQLVEWRDAKIHVLSHTLHYGCGAFEGVRAYKTASGKTVPLGSLVTLRQEVQPIALNQFNQQNAVTIQAVMMATLGDALTKMDEIAKEVLPEGAQVVEHVKDKPPMTMIGHVTSSYWSPNCGRSIAMAVIKNGRNRMGQTVYLPYEGKVVAAKITKPVFLEEGEKANG